jgi:hypothetical protein
VLDTTFVLIEGHPPNFPKTWNYRSGGICRCSGFGRTIADALFES